MEYITTNEAASRLGVSPQRVAILIRDGRLKAEKVGGMWLIKPKDLKPVLHRKPGRPRKSL
jgi:excisionase family DNA binding protein